MGLGKLLSLPFSKFFNKDVLSSRDYRHDSFVDFTDLYHVQRKEPHWLLNCVSKYFVMSFPTRKSNYFYPTNITHCKIAGKVWSMGGRVIVGKVS